MQPRTYALSTVAVGLGLFFVVVASNILIDPVNVFGTGLLPRAPNANDRYERVVAYQAEPGTYDGLAFGSSRAAAIPLDDLSRLQDGVSFANFSVVGGMLVDHVAALKFVLDDKATRREPLRAVFLLLDADLLGRRPFTNGSTQFLMPPALSGESPARFWWKNLVTIQFKAWRSAIDAASKSRPTTGGDAAPVRAQRKEAGAMGISAAHAEPLPAVLPPQPIEERRERITQRANYREQLEQLRRLAALCRSHGIRLDVATSPLSREGASMYDAEDLQTAINDAARIVPLWDFTNSEWASSNPELWRDTSHFQLEVGRMLLRRMYGGDVPALWSAFGRRLPR